MGRGAQALRSGFGEGIARTKGAWFAIPETKPDRTQGGVGAGGSEPGGTGYRGAPWVLTYVRPEGGAPSPPRNGTRSWGFKSFFDGPQRVPLAFRAASVIYARAGIWRAGCGGSFIAAGSGSLVERVPHSLWGARFINLSAAPSASVLPAAGAPPPGSGGGVLFIGGVYI